MDKEVKQPSQGPRVEGSEAAEKEPSVPLSVMQAAIDKAVAAALLKTKHQHTPIEQVLQTELSGRSREEGTLVVSKLDETKGYTEWGFNDGTIRRDYK